jgi:hypothetical protein
VSNKNQWFLLGALVTLLVAALWCCVAIWQATPSNGNVIMGVAAVFALVAGRGLTALMSYSYSKGHGEPVRSDRMQRE